ncbi:Oxidoreductase BOA1 [Paramyrothecium foliicola]|nr:Oxidoreductase BOA1 [Paramyrothecium foliicola]
MRYHKMSVVAVAGGTASIGRAIVEAIVAQGSHQVFILTRKVEGQPEIPGTNYVAVDYSNADNIVEVLESHNIDTVISALGGMGAEVSEGFLILAADRSAVTRRFIPSVFGVKYPPEQRSFPAATSKILAVEALQKTSLQWTVVCNGFFLDYWGMPKIDSYLKPFVLVIDIAGKAAAIPGDGNTPITFTYSGDVAKYTVALLSVEEWEEESYIIGDKITWNDFLKNVEEVTGSVFDMPSTNDMEHPGEKFQVTYDSNEVLRSGKVTELPSHVHTYQFIPKEALQGMLAGFGLIFDQGLFDFPREKALNEKFPDIKPLSVKDVLHIGQKS